MVNWHLDEKDIAIEDLYKEHHTAAFYTRIWEEVEDEQVAYQKLQAQKESVQELNTNWEFAGFYYDKFFQEKVGFEKLKADGAAGKLDLLIVETLASIENNFPVCLDMVRQLQNMNPPITVYVKGMGRVY